MRIFKNLRIESIAKGKIWNYLKYAFGETILLVFGLLIALQIDNHRDKVQQENRIQNILSIITEELKSDTFEVAAVLNNYKEQYPYYIKLAKDSFTINQLDTCTICAGLILTYQPITINVTGYNLLKNMNNIGIAKEDSLYLEILQFYTQYTKLLELNESAIAKNTMSNIEFYRDNYDWFSDFLQGKKNEMNEHMLSNKKFKNRLIYQSALIYGNYSFTMKNFLEDARPLLNQLAISKK